jgi:predicted outer membrane protein
LETQAYLAEHPEIGVYIDEETGEQIEGAEWARRQRDGAAGQARDDAAGRSVSAAQKMPATAKTARQKEIEAARTAVRRSGRERP